MNLAATRRRFMASGATFLAAASRDRGAEPDRDLVKAMEAVRAAIPTASQDPDRPIYHFHPPSNGNNDPNGTLFYKGWHHLFYQLNPFGATISNQHWGHARSKDLVNWEHLPIAIWPSADKTERAIFSGGAIVANDGRPRLIYTSIGHPQPERWMVVPEDEELISWKKFSGNPVLTTAAHGSVTVNQWRDPFLFREAGQIYMVCGGNANTGRGGAGQVQLYRATKDDLSEWKHLGAVFQALEVYVNDGTVALYSIIEARPEDRGLAVFARTANPGFGHPNAANRPASTVRLESLTAWPMKPASFSLDHFHV